MSDDDPLLGLSQAVADGASINWAAFKKKAPDDDSSAVDQLHVIATIGAFHRSPDDSTHDADLPPGAPWGSLEIIEPIARGGFGRVYRARDARLQRDVALKIFARRSANGVDDVAVREARLLARVRHPNVVVVYAADVVGVEAGMWMELIDGHTLSEWVAQHGTMGADEAVMVGITLCRALAVVHHAGLLHRDIKPQNVMREPGGRIVLMDFGAGRDILDPAMRFETGTPICLAPEILSGSAASIASDIYSLGVLLFYLVTGRYPATASSLDELKLWHANHRHPSVRDVRPDLPATFVAAVGRALESNPHSRFESAAQFEQALLQCVATGGVTLRSTFTRWQTRSIATLALVGALVSAGIWWGAPSDRTTGAPARGDVVRFQIHPPAEVSFPFALPRLTLSPDGRIVTFLGATPESERRIWVQDLGAESARPLLGTEYSWMPAWSGDGKELLFVSAGVLRRYTIATRTAVDLLKPGDLDGISWNSRKGIIFPAADGSSLLQLDAAGGAPVQLSAIDGAEDEIAQRYPQILPDAQSLLYLSLNRQPEHSAVYVTDLQGRRRTHLIDSRAKAMFVDPGILLYLHESTLYAQRFDVARRSLDGKPVSIATGIPYLELNGSAEYFATARTLVYGGRPRLPGRELQWVDRTGRRLAAVAADDVDGALAMSPDGRWLALERPDMETRAPDLWLMDVASGRRIRATNQPANDESPVWAPDSRRYVYARHPAIQQPADLYVRDRLVPSSDEPVFQGAGSEHPSDWSRDGRLVLFDQEDGTGTRDIYMLNIDGDRQATPWLKTRADERRARFSPNGRWIAYESSEGGPTNVFVRARESNGRVWRVSSEGGSNPLWRSDGRELYFISARDELMAVNVGATSDFLVETPARLFGFRQMGRRSMPPTPYAVSADGKRFVIADLVDPGGQAPISVILNWQNLLKNSQ